MTDLTETTIAWIRENMTPRDVFGLEALNDWAKSCGAVGAAEAALYQRQEVLLADIDRFRRDPWAYCAPPIRQAEFISPCGRRLYTVVIRGNDITLMETVNRTVSTMQPISPSEAATVRNYLAGGKK